MQRLAVDGAVLPPLQKGAHLLGPHGLHLPRDAGHQGGAMAVFILEPGAGGGAVGVGQLVPPHRHHGLFAVVFGGGAAGAGKKVHDLPPFFRVKGQRIAKGVGHRLFGQVVGGGAKPAGKHQQVAAGAGGAHQLFQPGGVVPHHMLVQHGDAQLGQFPAQKPGVGVDDVAQQKLGANADDLGGHGDIPSLGKQFKRQAACAPLTFPGRRQYGWGSFPHWRRLPAPARPGRAWRPRRPRSRPGWAWSWGGAG